MAGAGNTALEAFIDGLYKDLDTREREVLRARYGLDGKEPQTLQAIGDRYNITRERVRQIENTALQTLRPKLSHAYAKQFVKAATQALKRAGGVKREDAFLKELRAAIGERTAESVFQNAARFLLDLSGAARAHDDVYGNWHPFWHVSDEDKRQAQKFIARLVKNLHASKDEVIAKSNFDTVVARTAKAMNIPKTAATNYIDASKQFVTSPFNEFGLAEWPEIYPRTARDWAYLILKREKQPMHFSELARRISSFRKNKYTNMQTIHNELIKDDRFVLVGRGLYGLEEHGFIPGTAREIIAHVLKQNGPLKSEEVVRRVSDQRKLKTGTILINLQNKEHFECMSDGRYCMREA